ncbi:MAG: DUF4199 domain-containing protein [Ekhidna sp.]|nr:DUF4199 domain-containing protein [Ekhidna sp.]MBC6409628.1 DUF4199 domain-containing protein [Ekhidna sp.]MBC6426697.1 DUF4199 domain-containing protein [Ekhidna sp.]
METSTNTSAKSINLKWGLIGGFLSIIFFLIIDFTGQSQNQPLQYLGIIFAFAVTFLAHKEYKEQGNGYMSYSKGLGIGTMVAVISSVISAVFTYIYLSFINDQRVVEAREKAIWEMEQSDTEIEQAMSFVEPWISPLAFLFYALIGGIFFGFIISLIVSIFSKNQDPEAV